MIARENTRAMRVASRVPLVTPSLPGSKVISAQLLLYACSDTSSIECCSLIRAAWRAKNTGNNMGCLGSKEESNANEETNDKPTFSWQVLFSRRKG